MRNIKRHLDSEAVLPDVHVRKAMRRGRKCWTIIEGLDRIVDVEEVFEVLKKVCKCGGSIDNDSPIKLQGCHVDVTLDYLTSVVDSKYVRCSGS